MYRMLVFGVILCGLSNGSIAQATQFRCPERPTPAIVTVKMETTPLTIHHRLTRSQLQRQPIDTISPYADHYKTHVNGMMRGTIGVVSKTSLAWQQERRTAMHCLWYQGIEVRIQFNPAIEIAKEIPKDSCLYKAVLEHEYKHYAVDQQILDLYKNTIQTRLQAMLDNAKVQGPYRAQAVEALKQTMTKTIDSQIQQIHDQLQQERRQRQQVIDTLEEYQRVAALCPNDPQF